MVFALETEEYYSFSIVASTGKTFHVHISRAMEDFPL